MAPVCGGKDVPAHIDRLNYYTGIGKNVKKEFQNF